MDMRHFVQAAWRYARASAESARLAKQATLGKHQKRSS